MQAGNVTLTLVIDALPYRRMNRNHFDQFKLSELHCYPHMDLERRPMIMTGVGSWRLMSELQVKMLAVDPVVASNRMKPSLLSLTSKPPVHLQQWNASTVWFGEPFV